VPFKVTDVSTDRKPVRNFADMLMNALQLCNFVYDGYHNFVADFL